MPLAVVDLSFPLLASNINIHYKVTDHYQSQRISEIETEFSCMAFGPKRVAQRHFHDIDML
jgi:hypothetical protein